MIRVKGAKNGSGRQEKDKRENFFDIIFSITKSNSIIVSKR
jgi:hypothetical protein